MIARVVKIPNDRQLGLLSSSNEGPRHTSRVVKKNLTHGQWSCRVVCATQSADRNLVRLPRRIPSLSLKADTKMKTTNLKQTSVAKPRKCFRFRDQPPSREATASHRRSSLHLREFAKNSRIFAAFAPGANRAPRFFFPRKSVIHNCIGIR